VHDYSRIYGLQTVVFRHSSMYGGRQFATYDQGWIGWFCQKAIEMKDPQSSAFTISGDGKQVRDVLHARDLVQVYLKAVENIGQACGQVYNIGGGIENSLSLLELFQMLGTLTGFPMRFKHLPWRDGDQKVFVADVTKATRNFGWRPTVSKEDGIQEMLEWSQEIYHGN
jgi:CDP-paratose 2-epimerase